MVSKRYFRRLNLQPGKEILITTREGVFLTYFHEMLPNSIRVHRPDYEVLDGGAVRCGEDLTYLHSNIRRLTPVADDGPREL